MVLQTPEIKLRHGGRQQVTGTDSKKIFIYLRVTLQRRSDQSL